MTLREITKDGIHYWIGIPQFPVNLYVDYFMICHGVPEFDQEYIFPNNEAEIFFNLADRNFAFGKDENLVQTFTSTIVSGLRSERLTITPGGIFSLAGVRFNIFGFYQLFKIPANEFTDRNFDASDVWNREMLSMHEQLVNASDTKQRMDLLERWIKSAIDKRDVRDALFWKKITPKLSYTSLPLQDYLSSAMGYSHKHIIQLFKEKCGLAPKMIQRVFRFNSVLIRAVEQSCVNWTSLSHEAGYTDQSHFIRDFKQFTGFTPLTLRKQRPKDWMLLKESR
ncbi:MAG TPA: helix-turn-helix domain-containing protein [Chryseolinea sp.]|nr:helix-turn-helix domain-containing protein [Chryseolinea sp.]